MNLVIREFFPVRRLSAHVINGCMNSYTVHPCFETLSIPILVQAGEYFQERILHRLLRLRHVTDNTQTGDIQPLCKLLVKGELCSPVTTPALLDQMYICFFHFHIYKRRHPEKRCIFPARKSKKDSTSLKKIYSFPRKSL